MGGNSSSRAIAKGMKKPADNKLHLTIFKMQS